MEDKKYIDEPRDADLFGWKEWMDYTNSMEYKSLPDEAASPDDEAIILDELKLNKQITAEEYDRRIRDSWMPHAAGIGVQYSSKNPEPPIDRWNEFDDYIPSFNSTVSPMYARRKNTYKPLVDALREKPKRTRYPSYKKEDRVQTPEGPGNVWSVDRDGTVCVELDKDPSVLYEFEKKELKKIKK